MFSWDGNGDATKTKVGVVFRERTIHVPRERDDGTAKENVLYLVIFQSTFLVRGTTPLIVTTNIPIEISIHIPRERDDKGPLCHSLLEYISIHVPRERDDATAPTPDFHRSISIHVPRERDDSPTSPRPTGGANFNPRPS